MESSHTYNSIESLIKPILEDDASTNDFSFINFRKGSFDVTDYKIKYKTEKCRYWSITRECPFGDTCAFAHFEFEIREKIHTSPNYKTKLCKNFAIGVCTYGDRCQFRHEMQRVRIIKKGHEKYQQLLDTLADKYSEGFGIKRLKVFEQLEEDSFDKIDWRYKKTRMYSL